MKLQDVHVVYPCLARAEVHIQFDDGTVAMLPLPAGATGSDLAAALNSLAASLAEADDYSQRAAAVAH